MCVVWSVRLSPAAWFTAVLLRGAAAGAAQGLRWASIGMVVERRLGPAVRAAVAIVPAVGWVVVTLVGARGIVGGVEQPVLELLWVSGFWHVGPAVWIGVVLHRLTARPSGPPRRPAF